MRSEQPRQATGAGPNADRALLPSIALPKGGGAIRGIGEKFGANPVTGTATMTVPLGCSPHRFGPALAVSYDSGAGNGPFGLGWTLPVPSVTRKTDKGLPLYRDAEESDVFILSDAEDLVPVLESRSGDWVRHEFAATCEGAACTVHRYRPRVEGLFARIERWTRDADGTSFWKAVSKDNVASLYGVTSDGRVADPKDATRIFTWLLQYTYDDKGNVIVYEYAAENRDNAAPASYESNREVGAGRYLKSVRYGNRDPFYPDPASAPVALPDRWLFHLVFDYGDHDSVRPGLVPDVPWPARVDPFSTYRAGFEVRRYRLCRRALMFHDIPELGATPCLVRSTDFTYQPDPVATTLRAVHQTAYLRNPVDDSYTVVDRASGEAISPRPLPPVEFTYSDAIVDDTLRTLDEASLENLPSGVDGVRYQWVDLDSEGLPGVLTEQADGWFYTRNVSNLPRDDRGNVTAPDAAAAGSVRAAFEPATLVAAQPSLAALNHGRQQLVDLNGEGLQCLVEFDRPIGGFYPRDADGSWQPYVPFPSLPTIEWNDPNLKFLDLDGDGLADVLISHDEVFSWYPSLGKDGFAPIETVRKPFDENDGPAVVFADAEQSIHVADLSGDGLHDIVRIRNGEVCYWPNLGYGRFGPRVVMRDPPWFDAPDLFDQSRVRLADIDGSGTTDIIYLGRDAVVLYFNQSGNGWSAPRPLPQLPVPDRLAAVAVVDLLGNGTACLVWSSPLPGDARRQMRYVDLMGGQKPHLLIGARNNLGAETRVHYAASTQFYLQDRLAGTPWITRLPFPVHVIDRVEVRDAVSRTRFVSRYAYHHGYFDGVEREFRGFALVEQWDTEALAALSGDEAVNIDQATALPATLTRTWFHTGAPARGGAVSAQFASQYYREPGAGAAAAAAMLLPDTGLPTTIVLPDGTETAWTLSPDEAREACRSLKGSTLRQEIYALDGTAREPHPYSVSEHSFTIRLLQPQAANRHAAFLTHAREAITCAYERTLYDVAGDTLPDPRVSHAMTLVVDPYGNPLQSVSIAYGRRYDSPDATLTAGDRARQKQILATLTESRYTNAVLDDQAYRTPAPADARTYELVGIAPQGAVPRATNLFRFEEMQGLAQRAGDGQHDIPYEEIDPQRPPGSGPYRRLIDGVRTLYRADDLSAPLPLGALASLALPYESYKLAFTPGLLAVMAPRIAASDAAALLTGADAGYQDLDGDGRLWIPSGRLTFSPDPDQPDLPFARTHHFLPQGARDPFGARSRLAYDAYDLLVTQTIDPVGNLVSAGYDYRVLQPRLMTDPNGNRTAVLFDILGLPAATAVMGKTQEPDGQPKGDAIDGVAADVTNGQLAAFFADPLGEAATILATATSRVVYDVDRFLRTGEPACAATLARETHVSDLAPGQQTRIQVSVTYSDGFGREIQKKASAEPGPIDEGGAVVAPRWVASGWTIFNNKGKPVRQYEPFFTATHDFEFGVQRGVSATRFYDPTGRVVATLHPNQTYDKVRFDPWRQETWDANDTVLLDPLADPDVAAWFARLPASSYSPGWRALRTDPAYASQAAARWPDAGLRRNEADAANAAAKHAGTPSVTHMDPLARAFVTVADNGGDGLAVTRLELDIQGNHRAAVDALDRIVAAYDFDLLGSSIHLTSLDAGERWMLNDVAGKPFRSWDARGHAFHTEFDALRRPTRSFVRGDRTDPAKEILFAATEYGEGQNNDVQLNLRTRVFRQYDAAGVTVQVNRNPDNDRDEAYDFKGNQLGKVRHLALDYTGTPDWSDDPALDPNEFVSSATFDALNRPTTLTTPDGSIVQPTYNDAGLLETVAVDLHREGTRTRFVTNIDYDAKGQRQRIDYGNGVRSDYAYDPETFRLTHLYTSRSAGAFPGDDPAPPDPPRGVQNLHYTYDPVGNITAIRDDAQQTVFFDNQVVVPQATYVYDAIYRLVAAQGREHIGQLATPQPTWDDRFRVHLPHPQDGSAMRAYAEQYGYDAVGNILNVIHQAANGNWRREYRYRDASPVEPSTVGNRLSGTVVHPNADQPIVETYAHDAHGNITAMPHLATMAWDVSDRLQSADLGGGGTVFYVYDAAGQRVRKVIESHGGVRQKERISIGGWEVYREYDGTGGGVTLERETLHLADGAQRIALVETRTQGADDAPASAIRYQFGNHLGSAALELDQAGAVISYEEYYPYGSTSYQAGRSVAEVSLKRYRYTGKERDEESGFTYHGARYYAPWLARWTACDPAGLADGPNPYAYTKGRPLALVDATGRQSTAPSASDEEQPLNPSNFASYEHFEQAYADVHGLAFDPAAVRAIWDEAHPVSGAAAITGSVALTATRQTLKEAFAPIGASGERLEGPIHFWSDPDVGKPQALAAKAEAGTGWTMGELDAHEVASARFADALRVEAKLKFPGVALTDKQLFDLAKSKQLIIPKELFQEIWDKPSRSAALSGALSTGAQQHNATPGSVQMRIEIPTVQRWGSAAAGLDIGGGFLTLYAATQETHPVPILYGTVVGTTQVTGGIISLGGAILVNGELMTIGATVAETGGAAALPLMMYANVKLAAEHSKAMQPLIDKEIKKGNNIGAALLATPIMPIYF